MSTSDEVGNAQLSSTASNSAVVVEHDGSQTPLDVDWFAPPPAEIGELRSAHSSLKQNKQPWVPWSRVLFCGAIGAGIYFAGDWAATLAKKPNGADIIKLVAALAGIGGALLAWYATRFKHHVSYVGKLGLARTTISGNRESPPRDELFVFASAVELRTGETRHYHNGVYTGTHYHFQWTDAQGRQQYKLSGQYSSQKSTPKTKDPYWFAKAGELAWYDYLFDAKAAELEQQGYLQFNLSKSDFVRLGPGFMEFAMKGELNRVTPADIKSVNLGQGTFTIKTHEAHWFSSKGKFSFSYANMANARLFLIALDRLLGYRFS